MKKKLPLLLLITLLLPACSVKDAAQRMSLTLKRVQVKEVTQDGFNASVFMQVDNPNRFGLRIASLNYRAEINGCEVATGMIQDGIEIPAGGSVMAELPVAVSYERLRGDIFDQLRGRLDYRLTGEAVFKTWFGSYTLPFDTRRKPSHSK